MEKENIIQKIFNLRKITVENGATEAEVANAAALAQALLIKYNIAIHEISDTKNEEKVGENKSDKTFGRLAEYKIRLMSELCDHYFCKLLLSWKYDRERGKNRRCFNIIGRATNVMIVNEMFEYLDQAIIKLSYDGWYESGKNEQVYSSHVYLESWRQGCVSRIGERLEEKRREMEKENVSSCTALQIINAYDKEQQLIDDFIKEAFPKLGQFKRRTNFSHAGFSDGYDNGDKIGLDQQLKGKRSQQKQLTH